MVTFTDQWCFRIIAPRVQYKNSRKEIAFWAQNVTSKSLTKHTHTHTYPKKKKQPQFEKAMVTFCPKKLNQRHLSLMAKFGYLARSTFHSTTWRWCVCVFKWVSSVVFVVLVVFLFPKIKFIVFEKDEMTKKNNVCVCLNEFLVWRLCFWLCSYF